MKVTGNSTEEDKQLLSLSISNIIDEILTNYNAGIAFCKDENEFILILNQNVQANGKYSEVLEEISLCINKYLGITVSIGVGCPVSRIFSANSSYKDAFTALQYRFYTGKNSILYISDIRSMSDVPQEGIDTTKINEYESQIMNSIKLGNIESVDKTIVNMFNFLFQNKNLPIYYIQSVCLELVFMTSRTILDLGETLDSIVNNNSVIIETIYKIENWNELKNYISTLLIKAAKHFSLKYSQKNSKIIGRIKEIIENNYKDDISVKKISEDVYLTPNYLSLIFKQETGETITEYITKIRMEHAKKLLKSTDLRIKEVAEMVGYDDPHYFSKVFKKYTGIYPQKFKA